MNKLQKRIMRRVYLAFARRVATHPLAMNIALFTLALFVFAKLVFVRSVIDNLMGVEVAQVPSFMLSALMHGEILTLIAIGVMTFTLLSVPLQIRSQFAPRVQTI